MTTTASLTQSFEQWLADHRESAHDGEWEQVMHNVIGLAESQLADMGPHEPDAFHADKEHRILAEINQ